uniref:Uncharacterized protein n=1 Tax=Pyrodinium bahamense TaxID=73915 RepID=A0A7S0B366_9DINO|mmetsp:Transcript_47865/g.132987  ORF Transcript_47865/g.132987 Transcript_47865/m.132987 type:complete len:155 (+) Transcript_47865:76-540(+)|eukprot:CAMPEP_0179074510 /NCGR_PEP_ID=MMETSP0796-20121207/33123_1 /TAXON_ID=73915 /ORGANISM="Pyrodinium bahamense, Strain pbaha01" /LENGTH=154 /DNA_ID=CAMNT_0020771735 /DNA_START=74 /DNA_END=538 /DNA_ORIENTATION=+
MTSSKCTSASTPGSSRGSTEELRQSWLDSNFQEDSFEEDDWQEWLREQKLLDKERDDSILTYCSNGGDEDEDDEGGWETWLEQEKSKECNDDFNIWSEEREGCSAVPEGFAAVDSETLVPESVYEEMLSLAQSAFGRHRVATDSSGARRLVLTV